MKILNIGQCDFDGPQMEDLFERKLRAQVVNADNIEQAGAALEETDFDLILVNRVLANDEESGLDVIKHLREADVQTPMMLVSDYEEAQEQAVRRGAVHGFGKSTLTSPNTLQRIREAAGG